MIDFCFYNRIEIGSISIKSKNKDYQLTSAYISLSDQNKTENEIVDISQECISLISYEIIDEDNISLFIDSKKFEEMLRNGLCKNNEMIFQEPYIIKVHIHDMLLFKDTYYLMILKADKIIKSPNANKYSLNIEIKDGDENFNFSPSQDCFYSYILYPKKEENDWIQNK